MHVFCSYLPVEFLNVKAHPPNFIPKKENLFVFVILDLNHLVSEEDKLLLDFSIFLVKLNKSRLFLLMELLNPLL